MAKVTNRFTNSKKEVYSYKKIKIWKKNSAAIVSCNNNIINKPFAECIIFNTI